MKTTFFPELFFSSVIHCIFLYFFLALPISNYGTLSLDAITVVLIPNEGARNKSFDAHSESKDVPNENRNTSITSQGSRAINNVPKRNISVKEKATSVSQIKSEISTTADAKPANGFENVEVVKLKKELHVNKTKKEDESSAIVDADNTDKLYDVQDKPSTASTGVKEVAKKKDQVKLANLKEERPEKQKEILEESDVVAQTKLAAREDHSLETRESLPAVNPQRDSLRGTGELSETIDLQQESQHDQVYESKVSGEQKTSSSRETMPLAHAKSVKKKAMPLEKAQANEVEQGGEVPAIEARTQEEIDNILTRAELKRPGQSAPNSPPVVAETHLNPAAAVEESTVAEESPIGQGAIAEEVPGSGRYLADKEENDAGVRGPATSQSEDNISGEAKTASDVKEAAGETVATEVRLESVSTPPPYRLMEKAHTGSDNRFPVIVETKGRESGSSKSTISAKSNESIHAASPLRLKVSTNVEQHHKERQAQKRPLLKVENKANTSLQEKPFTTSDVDVTQDKEVHDSMKVIKEDSFQKKDSIKQKKVSAESSATFDVARIRSIPAPFVPTISEQSLTRYKRGDLFVKPKMSMQPPVVFSIPCPPLPVLIGEAVIFKGSEDANPYKVYEKKTPELEKQVAKKELQYIKDNEEPKNIDIEHGSSVAADITSIKQKKGDNISGTSESTTETNENLQGGDYLEAAAIQTKSKNDEQFGVPKGVVPTVSGDVEAESDLSTSGMATHIGIPEVFDPMFTVIDELLINEQSSNNNNELDPELTQEKKSTQLEDVADVLSEEHANAEPKAQKPPTLQQVNKGEIVSEIYTPDDSHDDSLVAEVLTPSMNRTPSRRDYQFQIDSRVKLARSEPKQHEASAQEQGLALPLDILNDIEAEITFYGINNDVTFALEQRTHPMESITPKSKGDPVDFQITKTYGRPENKRVMIYVEQAEKGVYTLIIKNTGKESHRLAVTFRLYSGREAEKKRDIQNIVLDSEQRIQFQFLLPEAVFWDEKDYFTGEVENSNYITKFNADTGLVWKERRDY